VTTDPYRYFRIESRDLLDAMRACLHRDDDQPAQVGVILRHAHTLKGAARVVGRPELGELAHAIEGVLDDHRETATGLPPATVDEVWALLDAISDGVAALDAPPDDEAPPDGGRASVPARAVAVDPAPIVTVRAELSDVEQLLDLAMEAEALAPALHRVVDDVADLAAVLDRPDPRRLVEDLPGLADRARRIHRQLGQPTEHLARTLSHIHDTVGRVRLVPARVLFDDLHRAVRDVAAIQGKDVAFELDDGDVRLDAAVIETVRPALAQLVRNAVAHGIEAPATRRAHGKDPRGRVRLSVHRRRRDAVFVCHDDGRGIALEGLRGHDYLADLDPSTPDGAASLLALVTRSGVTSSRDVTEIAGRGLGLDIVRDVSERLAGSLDLRTEQGHWTVFELRVPLSVTALPLLALETGDQVVAVPSRGIRTTARLATAAVRARGGRRWVDVDEDEIAFVHLRDVLGVGTRPATMMSVVVLDTRDGPVALGTDRLQGFRDAVVRPLPALMPAGGLSAGVWTDPSGDLRLLLDAASLARFAASHRPPTSSPAPPPPRVLVIDDSLTSRMLQRSVLEAAGHHVDVAVSGEDAVRMATRDPFDLFLVDVEMPGMDGFEFVRYVRRSPDLRRTPCVIVSSRDRADDLERGRAAGADGYVVKGAYDQRTLLATITDLLERT
jgi:two-component system chemotaxis sensor kinase CheA